MKCIYLDHNATTPVDPRVLAAMLPCLRDKFGNASSKNHPYGWEAKEAVEAARGHVAALLGASAREIVFTSGATEANNIALLGSAALAGGKRNHIISQATEHPAVLDTLKELGRRGFEVTTLRPDARGWVSAEQVREAINERTFLVSIMTANNEVGTIFPLGEIAAVSRKAGVLLHTDAAQGVGKIPVDVERLGIDLLALSAHKLYGPKGAGALYVRGRGPRVRLAPVLFGGGQENGLRPGTLNVPGIVGLGEACRLARAELEEEAKRLRALRDRLEEGIVSRLEGVRINGHPEARLPGTLSASFEGVDGTALLVQLSDLAVSSGAACSTGSTEPSRVLKALGLTDALALATLRFGVGRFTTHDEVERAAARVVEAVKELRAGGAPARAAAGRAEHEI
jgi:cysteine desulfurase